MPEWIQYVSFALAVLGSVLGVITTWRMLDRDRLKLRVRMVTALPVNAPQLPDHMIGVEVINLSAFPVTITEVGFNIVEHRDHRATFLNPIILDKKPLPRRLESRDQLTAYSDATGFDRTLTYNRVYAKTACGETVSYRVNFKPPKQS